MSGVNRMGVSRRTAHAHIGAVSLSPIGAFARSHDPDRFLCALFAPAERREPLFALIAYNHELARAREATSNPMAALIRLQWWRDAVEEARAGRPPRRHEVAGPLQEQVAAGALDADALIDLADAREAETEEGGFAVEQEFVTWLRGTAGGWSAVAGRALGADAAAAEVLRGLGAAYGLAGVLGSVVAHAAQGRCLLPLDRLAAAGLRAEEVIAEPQGSPVAGVVRALAQEGLTALAGARRDVTPAFIAAALPAVLARRDLRQLARAGRVAGRGVGDRFAVSWAGIRQKL